MTTLDKISQTPVAVEARDPLGPVGVWMGLSCGTLVYAMLLVLRFRRLANTFA